MTGFSAAWLRLREPADHRARNAGVTAKAAALFAGAAAVTALDLGCGTGSTVRALAGVLPPAQRWRLVDHDGALLAAAEETLCDWADTVESRAPLVLGKGRRRLEIRTELADLAKALPSFAGVDLVTTSALLDLVSAGWLARLAQALAASRIPFLAALSYDGDAFWAPPHPLDEAMRHALNTHQKTDKGFGPALGPDAAAEAAAILSRLGFTVERGSSPWEIGGDEARFQIEIAEGFAAAARALGRPAESDVAAWIAFRRSPDALGGRVLIGHHDVLALPGGAGRLSAGRERE